MEADAFFKLSIIPESSTRVDAEDAWGTAAAAPTANDERNDSSISTSIIYDRGIDWQMLAKYLGSPDICACGWVDDPTHRWAC